VAGDPDAWCESCRLTRLIPDLTVAGTQDAWYRLELAKRRVIYSLKNLALPIGARNGSGPGLEFQFLADRPSHEGPVLTGHAEGTITINSAEADDAERERRRRTLAEPYRTLLGHMRHETGHYYWGQLVADSSVLDDFRALFGDEREEYAGALRRHYQDGPKADWWDRFVSAYASAHPWEDWAETWAHYLPMTDTLEMAAACGVSVRPRRAGEPALHRVPGRGRRLPLRVVATRRRQAALRARGDRPCRECGRPDDVRAEPGSAARSAAVDAFESGTREGEHGHDPACEARRRQ